MRKLKLQMNISLDGYVARPNGELDWMTWDQGDKLEEFINSLIDSSDTILLGRKMTDEFVSYWENAVNNESELPQLPRLAHTSFAKKMVDIPKVVFTKTLNKSTWNYTTLAKGNLADEIASLKKSHNGGSKDIIVYGGAGFVSSLIKEGLIDEYHLFVNPTAIGTGMKIFQDTTKLELLKSTAYECGIVANTYRPIK